MACPFDFQRQLCDSMMLVIVSIWFLSRLILSPWSDEGKKKGMKSRTSKAYQTYWLKPLLIVRFDTDFFQRFLKTGYLGCVYLQFCQVLRAATSAISFFFSRRSRWNNDNELVRVFRGILSEISWLLHPINASLDDLKRSLCAIYL